VADERFLLLLALVCLLAGLCLRLPAGLCLLDRWLVLRCARLVLVRSLRCVCALRVCVVLACWLVPALRVCVFRVHSFRGLDQGIQV